LDELVWLEDALVFLIVAGVVVPVFHHFRFGSVLGFILAGVVVGPFGLGRFLADFPLLQYFVIDDPHAVEPFAEFGVVFLLFVLGLELSFARLWDMKRYVLGVGSAQIAFATLLIMAVVVLIGQSGPVALVVGLALALSSTAIVMQILVEERRLASTTGRLSLSVLLMQDLMVVPALVIVSLLVEPDANIWLEIGLAMVEAAIAVAAILLIGRYVLRPLLRQAALTGSRELIMGIVLFTVIGAAVGTESAGLSAELGAFLAGVLLAESEYRHQIEVDIEPFKGLLLGLFFTTVGMSIDLTVVAEQFVWIVLAFAGLIAIKAAVLYLSARLFAVPKPESAETAILLAQAGEFGFVVFALAGTLILTLFGITLPAFRVAGGLLLGLAVAVKATALVVVPFAAALAVAGPRRPAALVRAGALVVAGVVGAVTATTVLSGLGLGWVDGLTHSGDSRQWISPPTAVGLLIDYLGRLFGVRLDAVGPARAVGLALLAGFLMWLWWRVWRGGGPLAGWRGPDSRAVPVADSVGPPQTWDRGTVVFGAGLALAATVLAAPVVYPWYLSWPLALLAGAAYRTGWFLVPVAVAGFLVLPDGTGVAALTKAPGTVAMCALIVVLVVRAVRSARRPGAS